MALLGELGVVEVLAVALEIGTAVLPVGIEEQFVNAIVDVVGAADEPREGFAALF